MNLMKGEVVIDGKTYISASRAAQISGYNSDYIGQLCRKGILDSRMVGRLWFVCEESLRSYKENPLPIIRNNSAGNHVSGAAVSQGVAVSESDTESDLNSGYGSTTKFNGVAAQAPTQFQAERELAFMSPVQGFDVLQTAVVQSGSNLGGAFYNKVLAGFAAIMLFVATSAVVVSSPKFVGQNFGHETIQNNALVAQTLSTGVETATVAAKKFIEVLSNGKTYVVELSGFGSSEIKTLLGVNSDPQNSLDGVVVLPAAGVAQVNEQVKEYVRKSFSDEVVVEVDAAGYSGFIKPVFKNSNDDEYMFVMVPLKE